MAGLHILADAVTDQRRLRGAIDKRYKFVLVVFGEVFVFNLRGKRELRPGHASSGHEQHTGPAGGARPAGSHATSNLAAQTAAKERGSPESRKSGAVH